MFCSFLNTSKGLTNVALKVNGTVDSLYPLQLCSVHWLSMPMTYDISGTDLTPIFICIKCIHKLTKL